MCNRNRLINLNCIAGLLLALAFVSTLAAETSNVRQLQAFLSDLGFYEQPIDGIFGPGTSKAIITYQEHNDLFPAGQMTDALLMRLHSDHTLFITAAVGNVPRILDIASDQKAFVDVRDANGWTPLHWAVFYGQVEAANVLLRLGADANAATRDGDTPLAIAALVGWYGLASLLLEYGANSQLANKDGLTAEDIARNLGDTELLAVLDD